MEPVNETPAPEGVPVPDIIIRALGGRFVPAMRHYRMTDAELAVALGEPPELGPRIRSALTARRLHLQGDGDLKSGLANGDAQRAAMGKLRMAQAARLGLFALGGEQ